MWDGKGGMKTILMWVNLINTIIKFMRRAFENGDKEGVQIKMK